jgi:hypothetical protein
MREDGEPAPSVSRRGFVAASVVVAAGTAGCGDLRRQSFEASAVGLPDAEHEPLELAETTLDELSISFDGPAGSRVELTNHAGVYDRTVGTGGQ